MNRRNFIGGLSAFSAAALVFHVQTTDQQVAEIEMKVDSLDERVTTLETQVAELRAGSTPSPDTVSIATVEGQTVSGVGVSVSDKFPLQEGRYRVNATLEPTSEFTGFSVLVHSPSGTSELLFNELIDGAGLWEGSAVYQATESGDYFAEVSNTDSPWTLVFEPF